MHLAIADDGSDRAASEAAAVPRTSSRYYTYARSYDNISLASYVRSSRPVYYDALGSTSESSHVSPSRLAE